MKILDNQCDERSLSELGTVAVRLIQDKSYRALTDQFGYALAYGREPADAVHSDISECLSQYGNNVKLSFESLKLQ